MKVTEYDREKLILHRFGYYESSSRKTMPMRHLLSFIAVPGVALCPAGTGWDLERIL